MEETWLSVLQELVSVISGVILAGVSGLGAFYIKRATDNIKKKSVRQDIADYVRGAEQSPTYKDLPGEKKFELVFKKAQETAKEQGVNLSEADIGMIVESEVKLMKNEENKAFKKLLSLELEEDKKETEKEVKSGEISPKENSTKEAKG